jgi:hypothetical protein
MLLEKARRCIVTVEADVGYNYPAFFLGTVREMQSVGSVVMVTDLALIQVREGGAMKKVDLETITMVDLPEGAIE